MCHVVNLSLSFLHVTAHHVMTVARCPPLFSPLPFPLPSQINIRVGGPALQERRKAGKSVQGRR